MKIIISTIAIFFSLQLFAQNPCYIKYTYDASGNRIKREFICAPVDTLIKIDGDIEEDDNGGGIARMQNPNPSKNTVSAFDCSIIPNPTSGKFALKILGEATNLDAEIYNSVGQKLFSFAINNTITNVDLENRSAGVYYVCIKNKQQKVIKKIIKNE
jgi:Secretion system C-terminal sorting domain